MSDGLINHFAVHPTLQTVAPSLTDIPSKTLASDLQMLEWMVQLVFSIQKTFHSSVL